MHLPTLVSYISLLVTSVTALPASQNSNTEKPPYFILSGDSTTAVQSPGGGGWGTGFLHTLTKGAKGINLARNGATTENTVVRGTWKTVKDTIKNVTVTGNYTTYVTLQYGHNDQKVLTVAEFTKNLIGFVNDVKPLGGIPILVTPLSRRSFGKDGKVNQNLANMAAAVKDVQQQTNALIIDLNAASTEYLNKIGKDNAQKYNLKPDDSTHLNAAGSVVFGNLVAKLLTPVVSGLTKYLKLDESVQAALKSGTFILPKA